MVVSNVRYHPRKFSYVIWTYKEGFWLLKLDHLISWFENIFWLKSWIVTEKLSEIETTLKSIVDMIKPNDVPRHTDQRENTGSQKLDTIEESLKGIMNAISSGTTTQNTRQVGTSLGNLLCHQMQQKNEIKIFWIVVKIQIETWSSHLEMVRKGPSFSPYQEVSQ